MLLAFDRLETFLHQFPRLTIGLVGDLVLDQYLELAPGVHELSLETGLEAYQITRVRNAAGALGTVLNNLAALGVGRLLPVTVIGDDGRGFDLRRALANLPVDTTHVVADPERLTPTYTKPIRRLADGRVEELNRLDVRDRQPLSATATQAVGDRIAAIWNQCDGFIVLDQFVESNWGVVNDGVRARLAALSAADPRKLVYIDSRAHLSRFHFGVLKGNRREVIAAAAIDAKPPASSPATHALAGGNAADGNAAGGKIAAGGNAAGGNAAGGNAVGGNAAGDIAGVDLNGGDVAAAGRALEQLRDRTGRAAYCTCGDDGTLVVEPTGAARLIPGFRVTGPIDVCGAGDAATSGLVTSLLAGATPVEAATVGNLVASITVQQLGTTGTARPDQVRSRYREWAATWAAPPGPAGSDACSVSS